MRIWLAVGLLFVGLLPAAAASAAPAPAPAVVTVPAGAVAYNGQPATVRIAARPVGRVVVDRLQIVVNGVVKASSAVALRPGSYRVAGRVTYRTYSVSGAGRSYSRSRTWVSPARSLVVRHAVRLCGAPANPYGYNFCGGALIYSPASGVCDYFACIASFWNGVGYMTECYDGQYSMSGGRPGACSHHQGEWRPVYR